MSRKYLEIKEQITQEEEFEQMPEIIRVEVADEEEAFVKGKELSGQVKGTKKVFCHTHNHSKVTSQNQPCASKELDISKTLEEYRAEIQPIKEPVKEPKEEVTK